MKGKSLEEAMTIKNTDISNHLKLPPVKLHCSLLAEDAIKAAVNDYVKKSEKKSYVYVPVFGGTLSISLVACVADSGR